MKSEVNLKRASVFYLIGTLFNKGIGFLTVPIFTRILTVSDYGIVTTYNSWVSILMMIMSLALYMSIRSSFVDFEDNTTDFLSVILTFTTIFSLIFSFAIIIFIVLAKIDLKLEILFLCLLQAWGTAILENVSMYCMMKYQYKYRTLIMVLPNLLSTIIAIILVRYFIHSNLYYGRILPNSLITFFIAFIIFILIFVKSRINFNKNYIIYGLKISLPLVLHGIALNILSQSDRTMITLIRGASETGVYGLIYNFSMIATVITTTLDGLWIPFFMKNMKNNNFKDINNMSVKYIYLMTLALVGIVLIGPEVVKLIATDNYWKGILIIPPIILSNYIIFLYTLFVNIEHFYKKTIFISLNTLISAVFNIALNIIFIGMFGFVGAAFTTLFSYILAFCLHYMYAHKINSFLFPLRQFIVPTSLVILSILFFYFFINIWYIRWGMAVIICLLYLYKEKNWILKFLNKN